jgi:hypothetical protein
MAESNEPQQARLDYGQARRPSGRGAIFRRVSLAAVAALLIGYGLERSRAPQPVARPAVTPSPATAMAATVPIEPAPDVARVYANEIAPLLDQFDARNKEAAARAVANMHERLNGRRWGIRPFVKDVNSWKTRFGVIGKTTSDLWQRAVKRRPDPASVKGYVNEKFRHHVLSERAMEADVGEVLKQFREDLEASRNRLYVDVRLPLEKIKLPLAKSDGDYEAFKADVERRAREMGQTWGTDSVVSGLGAFVAGWVAADVAQAITTRVVVAVLSRVGTQVAAETIAAGGATAAGAAAGGGGGSVVGPAGTIIGLGVGIAIGGVVDWWMSAKFEAKMTTQLNSFFDSVDSQLIKGTAQSPGLERSLTDAVKLGGEAQRGALKRTILQEAFP